MNETIKTRNLDELLFDAESRAAAVNDLLGEITIATEREPAEFISTTSNKEKFDLANENLSAYKRVNSILLSLVTLANDVHELISEVNTTMPQKQGCEVE